MHPVDVVTLERVSTAVWGTWFELLSCVQLSSEGRPFGGSANSGVGCLIHVPVPGQGRNESSNEVVNEFSHLG
ncbi:hypothetical protein MES4922_240020 [Mesorhizobium ventifaucium]|uniref:Uncharacterized protein n=1 Tax=Mesorhizobium ventifaucium TaxID=666020 RepID=A0ABN8JSQ3_9HYPH|nr:hypothetical protein MES4922_240020 [Mesorhizobium ventifaucium]